MNFKTSIGRACPLAQFEASNCPSAQSEVSPRAGNDLYLIGVFLFCGKASKLLNFISNFLLLVVRVNKYQMEVLKLFVHQFHLLNLAKTASELGF